MNLKRLLLSFIFLAGVTGFPNNGVALDTDIYLTTPSISRDDAPNVLFIIDNSGSMDTEITSRAAYNPATDYSTLAGNPGIATGRIYWSTSTSGLPPAANTNAWFSTAKNNCEASKPALGTGGGGIYSGVKIVGYRTSVNSWRALSSGGGSTTDSLFSAVDCQADLGATDPKGYVKATGAQYTSVASQEINWSGLTGSTFLPRLYSANYMNYWYNNTLVTTQTRLQIAQNTLNGIIDANPNMRFGFMAFNTNTDSDGTNSGNHGGRLVMKIDTMDAARRTLMKNKINSLTASTNTPLTEVLWEAYRYFAGKSVDYGDNNLTANPKRDITAENPVPSSDAAASTGNYISPFLFGCQQAYVIYMTDGDPTLDTNADTRIRALSGIGTTSGDLLDELAGWMYNHDVITGSTFSDTSRRRVITYTIGFGSGISAAGQALLQAAATRGGGLYSTADDADALTAAFQSNLVSIMAKTSSLSAPSISVSAFNRLYNRDEVYLALFKPAGTIGWEGNVKKFGLCKDTTNTTCTYGDIVDRNGVTAIDPVTLRLKDSAISYWGTTQDGGTVTAGGAGAQITDPNASPAQAYDPAKRQLYTYLGAYGSPPMNLARIQPGSTNAVFNAAVASPSLLGLTPSGDSTTDTANVTGLINWLLGQDSYDGNRNGSSTDVRWAFGDPVHSRPVVISYGGTEAAPVLKLFVGTNDGVIHLINDSNGKEEWAFIPQELLSKQHAIALDTDGDHIYGMDGTPEFWVRDNNKNGVIEPANGDKVYMYIGMRRGGNNIYAFDMTPTTALSDPAVTNGIVPKLLWVIRGGGGTPGVGDSDYLKLGQTWSRPLVRSIRTGTTGENSTHKTVLIFGGGYDPNQDTNVAPGGDVAGNAIFIADAETGQRLWWASGTGSGATLVLDKMDYSIPSDLTVVDPDGDQDYDRIYAADTGGQIWRIDLSPTLKLNNNGTTATATKGFRFADIACPTGTRPLCSGTTTQDRRKFFYAPSVAQMDDSIYEDAAQSKYDIVTAASGDREDPLDLLTVGAIPATTVVHNRIYAFRDYNIDSLAGSTPPATALTESNLYDATSNALQDPTNQTAIDAIKLKQGWRIDLAGASWEGEKSLAKTVIFDKKLYVTTFTPANITTSNNQCSANEGTAKVYALNLLSAAAVVDYTGDGTLTTPDRVKTLGGGIPPEVVPVIREGGVTQLIGNLQAKTCDNVKQDCSLPRFKTFWYEE